MLCGGFCIVLIFCAVFTDYRAVNGDIPPFLRKLTRNQHVTCHDLALLRRQNAPSRNDEDGMKTLAPITAFTVSYVLASVLLAAVSYVLMKLFEFRFAFDGLVAAGISAVIAGHVFARHNVRFSSGLTKLGYAFGMSGIVAGLALAQMGLMRFVYGPGAVHPSELPTDLLLPLFALAYFAVMRLCFSVGANAAYRLKYGLTDLGTSKTPPTTAQSQPQL